MIYVEHVDLKNLRKRARLRGKDLAVLLSCAPTTVNSKLNGNIRLTTAEEKIVRRACVEAINRKAKTEGGPREPN
jgi:hypothetical protein